MFFGVFWIFQKKTMVVFGFLMFLVLKILKIQKNTMLFLEFSGFY